MLRKVGFICCAVFWSASSVAGCSDQSGDASAHGGQTPAGGGAAIAGSPTFDDAGAAGVTGPEGGSTGEAGEANRGGTNSGGGLQIPEGSFPWPADGGAPTAFETPLPVGCTLARVPPWWTDDKHSSVLGECDDAISSIPLDGTTPTIIAKFTGQLSIVDADSKRVVFIESGFLRCATLADGKVTTLASDVKIAKTSPDGARVVYMAPLAGSGKLGLYSVAIASGNAATLSDSIQQELYFDRDLWWFTADSQYVWFKNSDGSLAIVPVKGGDARAMGGAPREGDKTIWSSDGRKIAFESFDISLNHVARVLSADTDGPVDLLLPEHLSSVDVAISPAGDSVWFTAITDEPKFELMVTGTSSAEWAQLAKYDSLRVLGPVGKDGAQLLFTARNEQASPDLFIVSLKGGQPDTLGTLSSLCEFGYLSDQLLPGLSADKRKLAFIDSLGALLLADLDTAKSQTVLASAAPLTKAGLCNSGTILSPDTQRIALPPILGKGNTAVVDLHGDVLASDPDAGAVGYSFSPDSSLLEHHNLYGVRVLSIDDNEVKYTHEDAAGKIRDVVWIDGKRITVPVTFKSYEQIVSIE